ncbi:GNAT family N-acetyltransferase [Vibrio vulnificus]|uniref:GNAT family N-acetyltransferase n=1 Tax=Vibrio vulnificus TaxID=672 RepID=UPI0005F26D25|nr:GNAT family N-acetyltransferase [Vibrio vulnificus]MCJ0821977.1 GNAT family N-acetyltransferase [Vibrio vulnificus]HAS6410274.1 GNAT family N-acetyltransferase [Vibrio vulnificus]HAS6413509.1 GNAT family N-acetyltransferase [Vibrio vulnificus]
MINKFILKLIKKIINIDSLYFYKFPKDKVFELYETKESYKLTENCLYFYKNDDETHYSHYALGGDYISEINKHLKVPGSIYIYNCVTKRDYRGKGLYKQALSYIVNLFSDSKHIYICSLKSNSSSISTIEKVGFEFIGSVRFVKLLCLKIVIKEDINDEKVSFI